MSKERTMAANRAALFETISAIKGKSISVTDAENIIKACHEITDTFRVEIKGCEVAGNLSDKGLGYVPTVKALG